MSIWAVTRLHQLRHGEVENVRLKRLVANLSLHKHMMLENLSRQG